MEKMELLYPVDNMFRHHIPLQGNWYFALENGQVGSWENGVPRNMTMPVPANVTDVLISREDRTYCGNLWYERSVFIPKEWLGEDVFLRFDGMAQRGTVFVNGTEVGRHEGGYTPAVMDVTRHVHYGEKNTIIVRVNNELSPYTLPAGRVRTLPKGRKVNVPAFDFRMPSGLYGNVHLYAVPQTRILDVSVVTVEASPKAATIQYMAHVQGNCLVTATLRDREGRVVATGVGGNSQLQITLPNLWEIGSGYLYHIDFEVSRLGKQCDSYSLPFGIRTLEVKDGEIHLNGRPLAIKGARYGAEEQSGSIYFDQVQAKRELLQLKWLGGNCLFSGGYTLPEEILALADAEGVLIVDELPAAGLGRDLTGSTAGKDSAYFAQPDVMSRMLDNHLNTLKELILRDKNHASVWCWNIMYEPGSVKKDDEPYYSALYEHARSFDRQNRPLAVTLDQTPSITSDVCLQQADLILISTRQEEGLIDGSDAEEYVDALYRQLVDWHAKYPGKVLIVMLDEIKRSGADPLLLSLTENQAMLAGAYETLDNMPAVKGELLYNSKNISPDFIKKRWQ